jgi:hypothetical protein
MTPSSDTGSGTTRAPQAPHASQASAAERQTTLGLQHTEALPGWMWLWAPLVLAAVLCAIFQLQPAFYRAYFEGELAFVESAQMVVLLACIPLCLMILALTEVRSDRLVWGWILLALAGSVYVAGEEASWGQHYVGWLTPETWQTFNDQGETNLHNTSSWLDQKPRTLLEIGVIVGGIVIPLLALWRPSIRTGRFALFLPPLACLPVAVIAEVAKIWERLQSYGLWDATLFYRASEVQELYFYIFILLYLMVFRNRVLARRTAGLPARPTATA